MDNPETVVAIHVNERVICVDCIRDGEWDLLTQNQIITRQDAEEKKMVLYCDRCAEPI